MRADPILPEAWVRLVELVEAEHGRPHLALVDTVSPGSVSFGAVAPGAGAPDVVAADCATQTHPDRVAPAGLSARGVGVSGAVVASWERSATTAPELTSERWREGLRQRQARRERLAVLRLELAAARALGKTIRHANRARQTQTRRTP